MRPLLLVCLVLAACGSEGPIIPGGDPAVPPGPTPATDAGSQVNAKDAGHQDFPIGSQEQYLSGSRIKTRTINTADGAKGFAGWLDTQLGVECAFMRAADGETRCIPIGGRGVVPGYFADSGCSTPVLLAMPDCLEPTNTYVIRSSSTCPLTYTVLSDLRESVPADGKYWTGIPGNCTGVALPAGWHLFDRWTVVPPSTFAAATYKVE